MSAHAKTLGATSSPGAYPTNANPNESSSGGRLSKLGTYVQTNPRIVRILGGIGGLGLTAVSIMACFAIFNSFLSPLTYIQNIFFLLFGVAISIVSVMPSSFFAEAIYGQAHFMGTLHGRAFFFLYLGALLFGSGFSGSQASWVYLLIGTWMLLTAAVFLYLKCRGGTETNLAGSQV